MYTHRNCGQICYCPPPTPPLPLRTVFSSGKADPPKCKGYFRPLFAHSLCPSLAFLLGVLRRPSTRVHTRYAHTVFVLVGPYVGIYAHTLVYFLEASQSYNPPMKAKSSISFLKLPFVTCTACDLLTAVPTFSASIPSFHLVCNENSHSITEPKTLTSIRARITCMRLPSLVYTYTAQ